MQYTQKELLAMSPGAAEYTQQNDEMSDEELFIYHSREVFDSCDFCGEEVKSRGIGGDEYNLSTMSIIKEK